MGLDDLRKLTDSPDVLGDHAAKQCAWQEAYARELSADAVKRNRSGVEVKPLYTALDDSARPFEVPGEPPYTRGIYTTMHRGRSWTQRQLIGLGTPEDYNARLREVLDAGSTAISLLPCNSVFRGYDMDNSHIELLGTCGTVINNPEHMRRALAGVDLSRISVGLNDPTPFTLLAFLLVEADRQATPWSALTGTANQSDYLSHYIANHMFYRLDLEGARRLLIDKIAFCNAKVPRYNPLSVVGQHMQQAGATPAEAMAFTLSSAVQYARDCIARGMDPDVFLPRFTFFFDISVSFFEEVAKFRAGRRIWARVTRELLGAKSPRSWRMKFHGQTSGADLTRQQPLNNIARVTVQAMAGIFGGLQSLHTDAYDEAISCPTAEGARIAVATQNILRGEAGLTDVIDPLGGSHYVESLTDAMEAEIVRVMALVEDAGGMFAAAKAGLVQRMIGRSAMQFQQAVESGERPVVGVNCYQLDGEETPQPSLERPDAKRMGEFVAEFKRWKAQRSQEEVQRALDALSRAVETTDANVFASVLEAARAGATHQEICDRLRDTMGLARCRRWSEWPVRTSRAWWSAHAGSSRRRSAGCCRSSTTSRRRGRTWSHCFSVMLRCLRRASPGSRGRRGQGSQRCSTSCWKTSLRGACASRCSQSTPRARFPAAPCSATARASVQSEATSACSSAPSLAAVRTAACRTRRPPWSRCCAACASTSSSSSRSARGNRKSRSPNSPTCASCSARPGWATTCRH